MARSSDQVRTAAGLIGLATGSRDAEWSSLSWHSLAQLAVRERCVALAWLKSKEIILRYADADVAGWWRALALRTLARGHAHIETLSRLTTALDEAGVQSAILKGAPLSTILHGEPGARASADLDIWIPPEDRERAREILLAHQWQHADGCLPDDEAYTRAGAHGEEYLEVHSRLVHIRFAYLPIPHPEVARVSVGGSLLPVMTGSLLPAYLALHIARHRFAPVLWLLDFRTLWAGLDDEERRLARWTAQRCRVDRYLAWMLRRMEELDRVRQGDARAVKRLGLTQQRRDVHPMWRHVQLAPWPEGPFRAMQTWLAPPWVTEAGFGPIDIVRRVRRHWRAAVLTGRDQSRTSGVAAGDIVVPGEKLLRVARDVSLVGGRMWITTTGTSMLPTLADRDRVLIEPAFRVSVGDIVLVDSGGSPLLHRIIAIRGDHISTRGDSRLTLDAALRRRDIVARAVRARRANLEWSLRPSLWRRVRMRLAAGRSTRVSTEGSRAHA